MTIQSGVIPNREAAQFLGCSMSRILQLQQSGRLQRIVIGSRFYGCLKEEVAKFKVQHEKARAAGKVRGRPMKGFACNQDYA
jgi:predicted DNA-binding transcriptional regulator AlpA